MTAVTATLTTWAPADLRFDKRQGSFSNITQEEILSLSSYPRPRGLPVYNQINAKKLTGWILRTFKTRDELPMLTLFKSLERTTADRLERFPSGEESEGSGDVDVDLGKRPR